MSQIRAEDSSSCNSIRIRFQGSKWPQGLAKFMVLSIVLFTGLLLGILASLHMSDYLNLRYNPMNNCSQQNQNQNQQLIINKKQQQQQIQKSDFWIWGQQFPLDHNMSDSELLWMASFAPQRDRQPVGIQRPPRKVAFMFMTRGPLPLSPLWELFFKNNEGLYSIYIHALPGFVMDVPKSSVFYRRQIPSQETRWGEISMCDAERRLLANALLDHSNQRFVLLSESCIPLYNFTTFYNYVINSHTSFVSVFDDPGPFGRGRYNPSMEPEVSLSQWKKGSQWFEVDRKLAVYLVSDDKYYPKFRDFCRPACYVDEHYIPTMLSINFGPLLANRSLTAVDWSRGGSHPAMFGKDDVTIEFIRRFREGPNCSYNGQTVQLCFFFARKFSPNALEPLMDLLKDDLATLGSS